MATYLDEQGLTLLWQKIKSLQWQGQTGGEDPYLKHLPANFYVQDGLYVASGSKIKIVPSDFTPLTANRAYRVKIVEDGIGNSYIDKDGYLHFELSGEDYKYILVDITPPLWACMTKRIALKSVTYHYEDSIWHDEKKDEILDDNNEPIYLR